MSTENLAKSFTVARGVLANVTPDQYDLPTPCASWTVRELINHLVGGSHFFAASVNEGKTPALEAPDFTEGDPVAAYDEGAAASVDAFTKAGDKLVELPFGTMPASAFINIAMTDTFTHAWDLAKATAQPIDLDPSLAAELLEGAKAFIPDAMRGPEPAPFGPKQEAPADATNATKLAAFLGRTP
jgi:uncharacterized protein (TIGR03086 family)